MAGQHLQSEVVHLISYQYNFNETTENVFLFNNRKTVIKAKSGMQTVESSIPA